VRKGQVGEKTQRGGGGRRGGKAHFGRTRKGYRWNECGPRKLKKVGQRSGKKNGGEERKGKGDPPKI